MQTNLPGTKVICKPCDYCSTAIGCVCVCVEGGLWGEGVTSYYSGGGNMNLDQVSSGKLTEAATILLLKEMDVLHQGR